MEVVKTQYEYKHQSFNLSSGNRSNFRFYFLKKFFMKTNINLEELERKNNMVLQNLDRFKKYFPNIESCATSLAEAIEIFRLEQEMENYNF